MRRVLVVIGWWRSSPSEVLGVRYLEEEEMKSDGEECLHCELFMAL